MSLLFPFLTEHEQAILLPGIAKAVNALRKIRSDVRASAAAKAPPLIFFQKASAPMTAWDHIHTLAKQRLAAGESHTIEQAVAAVAVARPDLRTQYRLEPRTVPRPTPSVPVVKEHPAIVQLKRLAEKLRAEKPGTFTAAQALGQVMATPEGQALREEYNARKR